MLTRIDTSVPLEIGLQTSALGEWAADEVLAEAKESQIED